MILTYRDKCTAAVKAVGGTIENDSVGSAHCFQIMAPPGKVWAGNGLHSMVNAYRYGRTGQFLVEIEEHWKDMLSRVEHGVETCPRGADCEWCTS